MNSEDISFFLDQYDYDIRKKGDARWIDQKCTFDVVSIIADCILEHVRLGTNSSIFTVRDIWDSEYTRKNVIELFSKPDPSKKAANEYDKYFGQPIKLLAYSGVLSADYKSGRNFYNVNNLELLQYIALRPSNALAFLAKYITKVLNDSELYSVFEAFFNRQDKTSFLNVKDTFASFTIKYTNINNNVECNRIFTKVLNPLAFSLKKHGTIRGTLSKDIIYLSDLAYNRANWRDELSGKLKSLTRQEHESSAQSLKNKAWGSYTVNKTKKELKYFNAKWNQNTSEVTQDSERVLATQAHHIFPQNEFPEIAEYIENLIMLTPNQHFIMAHPENKTQYIDKDFQYICLISKLRSIMKNLINNSSTEIYNFEDYKFVLNSGFETNAFDMVSHNDFASILHKIDYFYSDFIPENKYDYLIKENYPKYI